MIVKVIGKVDGKEVHFSKADRGQWETTVPYDMDGMYIVEVTAYNELGTQAYSTKMLMIVDPNTLCIQLLPYDYYLEIVNNEYRAEVVYPTHCGRCCCE